MSDTNHMIMMTIFITISVRILKNSSISLAFSPILPMQMPNAIKKPIRPVTENHKCIQTLNGGVDKRADVIVRVMEAAWL